jgi:lipoprotein-anchoring transpeptidase ErfK/SrfK
MAGARCDVAGVTFAGKPKEVFVSARSVADELAVPLVFDATSDLAFLGSIPLDYESAVGDQRFVKVAALNSLGAVISNRKGFVAVLLKGREMDIHTGKKHAEIDKKEQKMRVYQGGGLVLTTKISTGKYSRWTPDGVFRIGDVKDAYHSSSKYGDAPMPWAVHVVRNIFIHGGVVPDYPASHGCVRLPDDAAKWFYNWIEPGTVVTIRG